MDSDGETDPGVEEIYVRPQAMAPLAILGFTPEPADRMPVAPKKPTYLLDTPDPADRIVPPRPGRRPPLTRSQDRAPSVSLLRIAAILVGIAVPSSVALLVLWSIPAPPADLRPQAQGRVAAPPVPTTEAGAMGVVEVFGPSGGVVFVDGQLIGALPLLHTHAPGEIRIETMIPGRPRTRRGVRHVIEAGAFSRVDLSDP